MAAECDLIHPYNVNHNKKWTMKPEDVIKAQNPVCVLYANDEEQCQHAKKRRELQSKAPS